MKTSKIVIKNMFGIRDVTLGGESVEISGPKGAGKTSVLDAIRYALTNKSDRDYVVRQGEDEGEILIETNSGLSIDRKAREGAAGTVKVRNGSLTQSRPAEFLSTIFTPLQLDPVAFCDMSRQEKNRVILSLIEFPWDTNWIQEKFGEIPQGVDYSKHILEVLNDIQAENGVYFQSRQNINRDIRNKRTFIEDIARDIPAGYDYEKWNTYPLSEKYQELAMAQEENGKIESAKAFRDAYDGKKRGIEAVYLSGCAKVDKSTEDSRAELNQMIARAEEQIKAARDSLSGLSERADIAKEKLAAERDAALAKLDRDTGVAMEDAEKEPTDVSGLQMEISMAEAMRKHLNEYQRMISMQTELDDLTAQSEELTRKIELARELPAEILSTATIPVEGLTVEGGVPLIHGLPISNLSDGELLELCVDITVSKPGQLEIILVDGAERLDAKSRERLYEKCKEKGLQLIATRVTDSEEMEVTAL